MSRHSGLKGRHMRIGAKRNGEEDSAARLEEARSDVRAVTDVLTALNGTATTDAVVRVALEAVRKSFGWAYGSYWQLDPADRQLHFAAESGSAGQEFRDITLRASFAEGVGLSGRAWKARDLVFVPNIGDVTDCVRAPAAQRAGVRSGVCFPITRRGAVV